MQIEKYICKNDINEWWVSSNSDDENQLNGLPKTWIAYQFKITEKMLEYFDWCFKHGSDIAEKLHYVPMPQEVIKMVEASWTQEVKADGQAVWQ